MPRIFRTRHVSRPGTQTYQGAGKPGDLPISDAADRTIVLDVLQRLVDGGVARWQHTTDGDLHLALRSGETFLLGTHHLTRIS